MHYYIDGYNLMFRSRQPSARSFSEKRILLLEQLRECVDLLGIRVTIVFDAQYAGSDEMPHHLGDLEVRYTSLGETTDDWIVGQTVASSTPHRIVVVTSDRQLARRIKRERAEAMSVESFNRWIAKKYQTSIKRNASSEPKAVSDWWIRHYEEIFQKRLSSPEEE